jgi:hypothetical protein
MISKNPLKAPNVQIYNGILKNNKLDTSFFLNNTSRYSVFFNK